MTNVLRDLIYLQISHAMDTVDKKPKTPKILIFPSIVCNNVSESFQEWFRRQIPEVREYYHKRYKITFDNTISGRTLVTIAKRK